MCLPLAFLWFHWIYREFALGGNPLIPGAAGEKVKWWRATVEKYVTVSYKMNQSLTIGLNNYIIVYLLQRNQNFCPHNTWKQ